MKKLAFAFLVLCVISLFLLFYNFARDPLRAIRKGSLESTVLSSQSYLVQDGESTRIYHDVVLKTEAGDAHFTLSLPKTIPAKLDCYIIVDGLETGRKSLSYVRNQGEYALIGYEYPKVMRELKNSLYRNLFKIRRAAFDVPTQVLAIIKWVQEQNWYNQKPVSLLGFSFGAVFIPAIFRLAEEKNIPLGPSVIAYGGAGFYTIFSALAKDDWKKKPLVWLLSEALRPLDPIVHLPHIQGEFLIINGRYDQLVPFSSALKLQNMAPQPKTIINLEAGHLQLEDQETIDHIMQISETWLEEKREN